MNDLLSDLYVKEADGLHDVVKDLEVFKGATDSTDGTTGLVTQPKAGDNHKFLQGDSSWGIVPDKIVYNSSAGEIQLWGNGTLISSCSFTAGNTVDNTYYTITFDANGGSGGGSMIVKAGSSLGLLANATRSGYTLRGWYTSTSGGSTISASTVPSENKTYYAQWLASSSSSSSSSSDSGGSSSGGSSSSDDEVTMSEVNIYSQYAYDDIGSFQVDVYSSANSSNIIQVKRRASVSHPFPLTRNFYKITIGSTSTPVINKPMNEINKWFKFTYTVNSNNVVHFTYVGQYSNYDNNKNTVWIYVGEAPEFS